MQKKKPDAGQAQPHEQSKGNADAHQRAGGDAEAHKQSGGNAQAQKPLAGEAEAHGASNDNAQAHRQDIDVSSLRVHDQDAHSDNVKEHEQKIDVENVVSHGDDVGTGNVQLHWQKVDGAQEHIQSVESGKVVLHGRHLEVGDVQIHVQKVDVGNLQEHVQSAGNALVHTQDVDVGDVRIHSPDVDVDSVVDHRPSTGEARAHVQRVDVGSVQEQQPDALFANVQEHAPSEGEAKPHVQSVEGGTARAHSPSTGEAQAHLFDSNHLRPQAHSPSSGEARPHGQDVDVGEVRLHVQAMLEHQLHAPDVDVGEVRLHGERVAAAHMHLQRVDVASVQAHVQSTGAALAHMPSLGEAQAHAPSACVAHAHAPDVSGGNAQMHIPSEGQARAHAPDLGCAGEAQEHAQSTGEAKAHSPVLQAANAQAHASSNGEAKAHLPVLWTGNAQAHAASAGEAKVHGPQLDAVSIQPLAPFVGNADRPTADTGVPSLSYIGPTILDKPTGHDGASIAGRTLRLCGGAIGPSTIVYAVSEAGGIFSSTDGQSWRPLENAPFAARVIAAHPRAADMVVIGTGPEEVDAFEECGVWLSSDAGDSWSYEFDPARLAQGSRGINAIAFGSGGTYYVAGDSGLFRKQLFLPFEALVTGDSFLTLSISAAHGHEYVFATTGSDIHFGSFDSLGRSVLPFSRKPLKTTFVNPYAIGGGRAALAQYRVNPTQSLASVNSIAILPVIGSVASTVPLIASGPDQVFLVYFDADTATWWLDDNPRHDSSGTGSKIFLYSQTIESTGERGLILSLGDDLHASVVTELARGDVATFVPAGTYSNEGVGNIHSEFWSAWLQDVGGDARIFLGTDGGVFTSLLSLHRALSGDLTADLRAGWSSFNAGLHTHTATSLAVILPGVRLFSGELVSGMGARNIVYGTADNDAWSRLTRNGNEWQVAADIGDINQIFYDPRSPTVIIFRDAGRGFSDAGAVTILDCYSGATKRLQFENEPPFVDGSIKPPIAVSRLAAPSPLRVPLHVATVRGDGILVYNDNFAASTASPIDNSEWWDVIGVAEGLTALASAPDLVLYGQRQLPSGVPTLERLPLGTPNVGYYTQSNTLAIPGASQLGLPKGPIFPSPSGGRVIAWTHQGAFVCFEAPATSSSMFLADEVLNGLVTMGGVLSFSRPLYAGPPLTSGDSYNVGYLGVGMIADVAYDASDEEWVCVACPFTGLFVGRIDAPNRHIQWRTLTYFLPGPGRNASTNAPDATVGFAYRPRLIASALAMDQSGVYLATYGRGVFQVANPREAPLASWFDVEGPANFVLRDGDGRPIPQAGVLAFVRPIPGEAWLASSPFHLTTGGHVGGRLHPGPLFEDSGKVPTSFLDNLPPGSYSITLKFLGGNDAAPAETRFVARI